MYPPVKIEKSGKSGVGKIKIPDSIQQLNP
jgi:hypothetical protein